MLAAVSTVKVSPASCTAMLRAIMKMQMMSRQPRHLLIQLCAYTYQASKIPPNAAPFAHPND